MTISTSPLSSSQVSLLPHVLAQHLQQRKVPKLDALRAFSALLVVLYHFGLTLVPAGTGVMIFFVISGFLITWLLLKEHDLSGRISLRGFYLRRALRIFPAFYVFMAVIVGGLWLSNGNILKGQVFAMALYVGNYYQGLRHYPETGLSHGWSLAVEEQYYLFWPACLGMLAHNPRRLLTATCLVILAVWACRAGMVAAGVREEYIYTAFETRLDHLLIGAAAAISLRYGFWTRWWRAVCAKTAYALFPSGCLAASVVAAVAYGPAYRNTAGFILDPLFIAVLLVQLIAAPGLGWMDARPIAYLGTISYSTYLYHKLAGHVVVRILPWSSPAVLLPLGIAATYTAAVVSFHLVERPFLRLKSRAGRS